MKVTIVGGILIFVVVIAVLLISRPFYLRRLLQSIETKT
jgi:hypothetical protein